MPRQTISDRIKQGYMINKADDAAIAASAVWIILPGLRAEHDSIHGSLIMAEMTAQAAKDSYHNAIELKNKAEKRADEAYMALKSFIIAKYPDSTPMLIALNIDVPIEDGDAKAVLRLQEVIGRWAVYNGTPDEIPASYKTEMQACTQAFAGLILEVETKETAMDQAFRNRNELENDFANLMKRIRKWLVSKLPDGKYDRRLQDYGFNPQEEMIYPIPGKVAKLKGELLAQEMLVKLTWEPADEAANYEVWRALKPADPDEEPAFVYLEATEHLYCHDEHASMGLVYIYKVRGLNRWHSGPFSDAVEIKCVAI